MSAAIYLGVLLQQDRNKAETLCETKHFLQLVDLGHRYRNSEMLQVLNILDKSKALCSKHLLALSNAFRTDQRANPRPGSPSGLRDVQLDQPADHKNLRAALTF